MGKSGKGKKMSKGSAIILVLVMIIAIATGIGTYSYLSVQTMTVYLFNDEYKAGTPVTADMFSSYSLPVDLYNAMTGTGNSYATVNEISDHINNADALLVDVAKYGPVFSNQFLSGGGTGAEIRLGNEKVAVELPADRIQGLGADIRIGSRLNIITSYSIDYYKYTGMPDDECFWFGSDYLGRDIWTRMWRGARISLIIAIVSVCCNVVIGVIYGSISGYYGGTVDMIMMRITEIINAFPRIVIVTLFIMVAGTGMFSIIMSLVIKDWVNTARMVRSQFYRFKGREYVLAARTLGVRDMALIFRHILPNSIGPIITSSMIAIPTAIFSESFLAYIGLGLQAPEPSIGVMLSQGQKVLLHYPSQVVFPAVVISLLMISFNLFGNGLRDAFDPTLRGAE